MAPGSPYGLRNTPRRSSKLIESQSADYRASPTPQTPRSRRPPKPRPGRGRTRLDTIPVDIESDNDVVIPETDDDDQPSKNAQYRGGEIRKARQKVGYTLQTAPLIRYWSVIGLV
ncbi:hypothetical protein EJ04DRAFT_552806 [Polyplosphaeria fusca]|uniref:Uncharacterized protein n=1 Tax=Polyplosphaeria fusca TaxID=682080 RepID=A0A9P4QV31_9PLEO|nr:hypothetical protein EJ04DRAFT_552806 [Polyplosphaeria fusca]